MIDIVFPDRNEKEFISMAEKLGYSALVFAYRKEQDIESLRKKTKLELFTAVFKGKGDLLLARRENARHILEKTNIDLLFRLENHEERDFMHQRNSGLNQVLCRIAREKGKIIGIDFSSVLQAKGMKRSIILGRMIQNVRLCRKYKVEMAIASFADSPYRMRGISDLESFGVLLGMEPKKALSAVYRRIQKKKPAGHIAKGIEKV